MFGRVITGDEGQDDDGHEQEVLSDTQLILLDFLNYFQQQHGQDYVIAKNASLEPFTERTNDRTAGYSVVLNISQFYDWNKCQIPESGASIPPSVDGLTLYDFCDADVRARLTSEQVTCLQNNLCSCDPVTEQINGTTIGTVASGGTNDQAIHDSAGSDVGTNANPSVISDATVTINSESLGATGDIVAQGSVDIAVEQGGAPVGSWDGSVWDVPASSCGSTAAPLKTGQTVSYATGDDGDLQEGREVDFTTLNEPNYFGNTNRFTDELGTQVYTNNIAIDWSTYDQTTNNVTGWYIIKQSATPWATAITNCTAFSVGAFTSGWYLPNIRQYAQILDFSSTSGLNYSPFNITFGLLNSSTTYPANTAQAWEGVAGGGSTPIFNRTKTINTQYLIARTFNTSEL